LERLKESLKGASPKRIEAFVEDWKQAVALRNQFLNTMQEFHRKLDNVKTFLEVDGVSMLFENFIKNSRALRSYDGGELEAFRERVGQRVKEFPSAVPQV
jgi:hypothetical protein